MVRTVVLTAYKYGEDPEAYLREVSNHCSWVLGQLEKCPKTDRPHLQAMAYDQQDSKWGFLKAKCHVETCVAPLESIKYCTKEETRLEGVS